VDSAQILHGADHVANLLRRAGLGRLTRAARSALGARSITVDVDGIELSGGVEHRGYLYRGAHGSAEATTRRLFRDAIGPRTVVLDIGAHLGLYALVAAREVGQSGHVYAFEPDPRTFSRLVRNVEVNGFGDRVTTLEKAVSDREGEVSFFLNDSTPAASRLAVDRGSCSGTSVSCTTIDSFLPPETRVGVVKLDVEGAELDALRGMSRTLAGGSDSLTLFVEVHPDALLAKGQSTEAVVSELESAGFRIELIDEVKGAVRPIGADDLRGKPVHLRCLRV
jgi:FkbM family methyltransferase